MRVENINDFLMEIIESGDKNLVITSESNKQTLLDLISLYPKIIDIKIFSTTQIETLMYQVGNDTALYESDVLKGYLVPVRKIMAKNAKYINYITDDSSKKIKDLYLLNQELSIKNMINEAIFKDYQVSLLDVYEPNIINAFKDSKQYYFKKADDNEVIITHYKSTYYEVFQGLNKVSSLLASGADIDQVALVCPNLEYENYVRVLAPLFNVAINCSHPKMLITTKVAKKFIAEVKAGMKIEDVLIILKEQFHREYNFDDVYELLINIINKYHRYHDDLNKVIDFIIDDFKNTKLKTVTYQGAVNLITIDQANHYEHVFVFGFNNDVICKNHKDNDYLTDVEKQEYYLLTANERNKITHEKIYQILLGANIRGISFAEFSSAGELVISPIISKFKMAKIIKVENIVEEVTYSKEIYQIEFDELQHKFLNFKAINEDLIILNNNLNKTPKFNGSVKGIEMIAPVDKLRLSSSALECFYSCHYRYYLQYILKVYKKNYYDGHLVLGNYIHEVLELVIKNEEITIEDINHARRHFIKNYDPKRVFSIEEKFYMKKLMDDILEMAKVIQGQFNNFEILGLELGVDFKINDKYSFSGKIDKVLVKDNNLLIIDYKTGNSNLDFSYVNQGLDMQNIIYIILMHHLNKDYVLSGTYRQNIKPKFLKSGELYQDLFKANGFTNVDEDSIAKLSDSYQNLGIRLLKDGSFRASKKLVTTKDFEQLEAIVLAQIEQATQLIDDNNFIINPKRNKTKDSCKYCNFKEICLKQEHDYQELKEVIDEA